MTDITNFAHLNESSSLQNISGAGTETVAAITISSSLIKKGEASVMSGVSFSKRDLEG